MLHASARARLHVSRVAEAAAHEDSRDRLLGRSEPELAHGLEELDTVDLAVARVVKLPKDVDDAQPSFVKCSAQLVWHRVDGAPV